MLFNWKEETFRWFQEASQYTGFDREMAQLLLPYLSDCRTLCDIGCGMAFADFELAPHFDSVTCVDISEEVTGNVAHRAEEGKVSNLTVYCGKGEDPSSWKKAGINGGSFDFQDQLPQFDAVMALFHGHLEKVGLKYLSYAAKKLILVTHLHPVGTTGPEEYRVRKCGTSDFTSGWLKEQGLSFEYRSASLEFGQPHRSLEEAVRFVSNYTVDAPENEIRAYVLQNIIETGREDFPLYTPKQRSFGIFVITK